MSDLIIGGSGFVGRNLARYLQDQGRDVVVLDRVADSTDRYKGRFIQADAQDSATVSTVVDNVQPHTVYHLAANSDISAGVADASRDFGDTLMTTTALRVALAGSSVRRLFFASSSAIFGVVDGPINEQPDHLPSPVSWYGKAKLASEYVLESLTDVQPDLEILFVRFPNVVGPLATHGVVYDFVRRLKQDPTRLQVLGDGNQTKPYVHVTELIDGIEFFLARLTPGVTRVNVGPTDLIDVKGIVGEVVSVLGVSPEVHYQDSPVGWVGDIPRYEFDTAQMRSSGFELQKTSAQAVRQAARELSAE